MESITVTRNVRFDDGRLRVLTTVESPGSTVYVDTDDDGNHFVYTVSRDTMTLVAGSRNPTDATFTSWTEIGWRRRQRSVTGILRIV